MLRAVKYQHSPVSAHRSNDIRILGLVAGFIDLLRMIDPLFDTEFDLVVG